MKDGATSGMLFRGESPAASLLASRLAAMTRHRGCLAGPVRMEVEQTPAPVAVGIWQGRKLDIGAGLTGKLVFMRPTSLEQVFHSRSHCPFSNSGFESHILNP